MLGKGELGSTHFICFSFYPIIVLNFFASSRRSESPWRPLQRWKEASFWSGNWPASWFHYKVNVICVGIEEVVHEQITLATKTVHSYSFISLDCNFIHSMKRFPDSTHIVYFLYGWRTNFFFFFFFYFTLYRNTLSLKHQWIFFQLHINGDLPHTVQEYLYNIFGSRNVNLKYITVIRTLL